MTDQCTDTVAVSGLGFYLPQALRGESHKDAQ